AVITASLDGVSGSAKVTVSAATLTALAIVPSAVSVPVGATQGLSAIGVFNDGSTQDVTSQGSWTRSSDGIATVSNQADSPGLLTGVSPGDVTVTASAMGLMAKASVTVVPATLVEIDISPPDATVSVGDRTSYRASGVYSDGRTMDLTAQ